MTIACGYPDTNDVARLGWQVMILRSTRNWIIRVLRQLRLVGVAYEIRFWISILANHANNKRIARTLSAESFPPYRFAFEAYSHVDYSKYYEGGRRSAEVILKLIAGQVELIGAKLLEWGCGPGRIVRHLAPRCRELGASVYATDYNRMMVDWCSSAIPGVTFSKNGLHPPLPFPDAFFDVVYSSSVFTHLSKAMHYAWLDENLRILKSGGLMIFTTLGDRLKDRLLPEELDAYEAGELIVQEGGAAEGSLWYLAYQSPAFIINRFLTSVRGIEILRHETTLPLAGDQDIWVVRKT
jgi:ubiquinone/menaquinone biosynthesis C-methylase UbiE